MKTSERGLAFICNHEACVLQAYPDPATSGEPWTIGVGHTGGVKPGDTCTMEEAMQWLKEDVAEAEEVINRVVRVELSQDQFDALVSLVFNIGGGNFERSTLLKKINALNFDGASDEFPRWNRAAGRVLAGLTKRRLAESRLFSGEFA